MEHKIRGFEEVREEHKKQNSSVEIQLPIQATKTSAGYDWYCPVDVDIPPQSKVVIHTDIKAYMQPGEVLLLVPRSSFGIKHDLMIANTIGVIDEDYYGNQTNDGNCCIVLRNLKSDMRYFGNISVQIDGKWIEVPQVLNMTHENTVRIKAGERIVQGIFVQALRADNGNSASERIGGVGSTGK